MNWGPIIAVVLGPIAVHLVGQMVNGPEAALRQRLMGDIAIRDSLPEGAEKDAYAATVVLDARRLHNLRGVINAQRSCTRMLWAAGVSSAVLIVSALTGTSAMTTVSVVAAAAYVLATLIFWRARVRIGRIRQGIQELDDPPTWIWRHALWRPLRLNDKAVEKLVRSADDVIRPRVGRA